MTLEDYIKILLKEKFETVKPNFVYLNSVGNHSYYLADLNDNLYEPMSDHVLRQYGDGDGNEITSKKMNAIYSSSALAYNIFHKQFCTIKKNNILSEGTYQVTFEKKFPVLSKPANIDVVLDNCNSKEFIAIEMKMLEWLRDTSKLSDSYLNENKYLDLESGKIFSDIAQKLKAHSLHYDAYQMFKHSVGLYNACKKGLIVNKEKITLINCVWTIVNPDKMIEPHKSKYRINEDKLFNEFNQFRNLMSPVIDLFKSLAIKFDIYIYTVNELINIIDKTEDEINYLERYLIK